MAYKSKYYDPAKAHEYYMKHRKLKGKNQRNSTASLNEEGKTAAKEVKSAIMEEKKEYTAKLKEIMQNRIDSLKNMLAGLSKEERRERKAEISEQIKGLRESFKSAKKQVTETFKEKYLTELDKIKASPEFAKGKKRRR